MIYRLVLFAFLVLAMQACGLLRRDPAVLEKNADTALVNGDTSRAIKLLDRVVSSGAAAPDRYAQAGALYRSRGTIKDRLRSQKVLELGLQYHPDDATLWLELGKTNYEQTFYGDAARCFHRTLRLDADNCEARLYLGLDWFRKWKYVQTYKEYLAKAIPYFQNVMACDPDSPTAFYKAAFSYFARGDTLRAVVLSEQCIENHPAFAEAYLLRGTVAFRRARYERCDSLFAAAFSHLCKEERNGYRDIRHLLSDDEALAYRFAPEEKRNEIERLFWAARDPDLTTPLNERYLEHIQRMYLADAFYDNKTPRLRGWETERGKAVIKFGMPDGVGTTLAGGSLTGPMEMWIYSNEFVGMTLWFRDEFLNGNYMVPMDYRYHYAAQSLYLDPPATHYVTPYWEIPGFMDVITFRAASSATELFVAARIDLESMNEYIDFAPSDRFLVRTAFLDREWQPRVTYNDTLDGDALRIPAADEDDWYQMVRQYEVPLDSLHVAFCVEDDLIRTKTVLNGRVDADRYLTDKLILSDILLHQRWPERGRPELIQRGEVAFYPNPGGLHEAGQRLLIYVELYNLDVARSLSDYEITYSIFEANKRVRGWARFARGLKNLMGFREKPEPVISQTLQRRGGEHEAQENLSVDIDALDPGDYILHITVRDHRSGETAERSRPFVKGRPQPLLEER